LVVRKYQLFTTAYPSGSAAVHNFDVPACCTFYDGRTAWSSTLGAYAHLFRVNLVNPKYRSPTFGLRLVKYFKRYYALGFVHLATKELQQLKLSVYDLNVTPQLVCGNWATGDVQSECTDKSFLKNVGPSVCLGVLTAKVAFFVAKLFSAKRISKKMIVGAFNLYKSQLAERSEAAAKNQIVWRLNTYPYRGEYISFSPCLPEFWYNIHALAAKPGEVPPDVLELSMFAAQKYGSANRA